MVEVKLQFPSLEEAIIALGKMAQLAADPAVASLSASEQKPRKPRNDAGRPRGSYKPREAVQPMLSTEEVKAIVAVPGKTVQTSDQASAAPDAVAAGPVDPTPATAVPLASSADVMAALERLFNARGIDAAAALLTGFGASRARDLKPEQYADFVAEVAQILDGAAKGGS